MRGKDKKRQAARSGAVRNVLRGTLEGLLLVVLFSVVALGVKAWRSPDTFPIKRVEVVGKLHHVRPAAVQEQIAVHTTAGFFTVDLDAIERELKRLPWVDSASVRRQWPETLAIALREQAPVARWGDKGLLNAHGDIFAPPVAQRSEKLPVLFGPAGRERELIRHYQQASRTLQALGLSIHALVEDERRAWHVLLSNGTPVA
ncbi:MAG: cell division protein FtsQ/DivIB, partial [Gammaproteobacteria bacterium]